MQGADEPERLAEMKRLLGHFCIAPSELTRNGIALENLLCFCNKGGAPFTKVPRPLSLDE